MSAPPIKIGKDGLPHCAWCDGETLCGPHKKQVEGALSTTKTGDIMGRATADLRYIIKRPTLNQDRHEEIPIPIPPPEEAL